MTTENQEKTPVQPQPSDQQLQAMRNFLVKTIHDKYMELVDSIRQLPIHQAAFVQAHGYFDTGMVWAKEAIYHGAILPIPQVNQTINYSPVTQDDNVEKPESDPEQDSSELKKSDEIAAA